MSRRAFSPLGSMSVLVQVALLAVFAVVASQLVVFAVVLTAPPPRPAGFSIAAAADALYGRSAQTADGRALKRRLSNEPPQQDRPPGPIERAIAGGLSQRMGRRPQDVRVWLPERGPAGFALNREGPPERPGAAGPAVIAQTDRSVVFSRRTVGEASDADRAAIMDQVGALLAQRAPAPGGSAPPETDSVRVITSGDRQTRFTVTADRLTFAPFSAAVRLDDGRWATVEPPRGLIDPWQMRLLIALGITALILAPLVWLMARRLTRPIRQFAAAAERLGADPDAPPLVPSGPSEVRTAIGAFNDMQASIRGHMRQRTQTIAAIAHDLRTPLTRLRFRAEQVPAALRDKMAADVEEMDGLIGQAMAFVRGEVQAERRERLDLSQLAADCAAGFAETGAAVTFSGDPGLIVEGDPAALRRAVANLIDNALKYGDAASVEMVRSDNSAVLTIADDGPGLPEDELETVFEPFQRGERSRNRQTGGAGLGLAVARQAARAAGGDATLANRTEGGLEARLWMPLAT
ncbi:ATP-binding protein [Brevundimonas sp. NIBR11]|uniref:ATP-binding protein n=1 Tax=Brevundimonas sp. NIBR11 TaxID=3015999 RepID=UPI0022F0F53D|nr:ATP-binding protein [Brevundimonas sp. NIBR11]WGM30280.1 Adaptive-response sensory-kinase SasA [Brevundimonas sp. NIBR11]